MRKRRHIWFGVLAVVVGLSLPRTLYAAGTSIGIIGEIIQNVGSVIKSVAEGIEAAYKTGTFIVDDQEARNARAALKEIELRNNVLIEAQAPLLWLIANYRLDSANWSQLKSSLVQVGSVVMSSAKLLHDLAAKLPPKTSEQISQLSVLYAGRATLIENIQSLPQPKTKDDLDSLKNLGQQWAILHKQLIELNIVLDNITSKSSSP